MESFANGSGCPVVSLFYCGKGQQMERVIEKGVKVLEKTEKDLSGIKAELELIRKGQEGLHEKNIGMMASPTVTITMKRGETGCGRTTAHKKGMVIQLSSNYGLNSAWSGVARRKTDTTTLSYGSDPV